MELRDANEEFDKSIALNSEYGHKVGQEFMNTGIDYLNKEQLRDANNLFNNAIKHQPSLNASIVKELLNKGKDFIEQGQYNNLDSIFSIAHSFDTSISKEICDKYYNIGNSVSDNESLNFYRKARRYCNIYNVKIGKRLINIAKNQSSVKETEKYKTEASKYVDSEFIFDEFAQVFNLNKGVAIRTISAPDKITVIFKSSNDFFIVERIGTNKDGSEKLKKIRMKSGKSKRYFAWRGTLVVEGIYDNTTLKIAW